MANVEGYRILVLEGMAMAASDTATPEAAGKLLRKIGLANAVMGAAAFEAMVDREAEALRRAGTCPYCGQAPHELAPPPPSVEVAGSI